MKKFFGAVFVFSLILVLAACGSGSSDKKSSSSDSKELIVGASNTPHAQILEQAKPILEKKRHQT